MSTPSESEAQTRYAEAKTNIVSLSSDVAPHEVDITWEYYVETTDPESGTSTGMARRTFYGKKAGAQAAKDAEDSVGGSGPVPVEGEKPWHWQLVGVHKVPDPDAPPPESTLVGHQYQKQTWDMSAPATVKSMTDISIMTADAPSSWVDEACVAPTTSLNESQWMALPKGTMKTTGKWTNISHYFPSGEAAEVCLRRVDTSTAAMLQRVTRSYIRVTRTGTAPPVVAALSLSIEPGQKVSTTGTGEGATTGTIVLIAKPTENKSAEVVDEVMEVEVKQPTISAGGTAGALAQVNELRLSRWDCRTSGNDMVDRATFAETDPDRIVVRIPLPKRKGEASVKLKVSTTGSLSPHSDVGAELDFKAESAGSEYFVSDSLAIVSDTDEDALVVGTGAENKVGDRTFIGKPGGKLRLDSTDLSSPIEVPIKGYTHKITIQDVFVGVDQLERVNSLVCYSENRRHLRNIYSKNLVRVDYETEDSFTDTEFCDAMASRETRILTGDDRAITSAHLPSIVDWLGPKSDTIKVVWISKEYNSTLGGRTLYDLERPDICLIFLSQVDGDADFAKVEAVVESHEIGHSLGLAVEVGQDHLQPSGIAYPNFHLMCRARASNKIKPGNPDSSGKHWFIRNEATIKNSPLCKRINP